MTGERSAAPREGPALETLLLRVADTPEEFLAEPRRGRKGRVCVDAVASDLCRLHGVEPDPDELSRLVKEGTRNSLAVTLLLCWLLADESLRRNGPLEGLVPLLSESARELAEHTASKAFVHDTERREELVRTALARLELVPSGETPEQAQDRLTSLSASERARVLAASRAAEERARAVREALARKAAEDSADKWSRE
jgi:hypothetical protein